MDAFEALRQQQLDRFDLGPALLSVPVHEGVVTLHRQHAMGDLYCMDSSSTTGIGIAGGGLPGAIGAMYRMGRHGIVFGTVPATAYTVEVTTQADPTVQTVVADDLFVAIVPVVGAALVSFKNADGAIVQVYPIIDVHPPRPATWRSRLRDWAQRFGLRSTPRRSSTYSHRPPRR